VLVLRLELNVTLRSPTVWSGFKIFGKRVDPCVNKWNPQPLKTNADMIPHTRTRTVRSCHFPFIIHCPYYRSALYSTKMDRFIALVWGHCTLLYTVCRNRITPTITKYQASWFSSATEFDTLIELALLYRSGICCSDRDTVKARDTVDSVTR
jgi:hypothetical protein